VQLRSIADTLHRWMLAHREKIPNGSETAKALDYSLTLDGVDALPG